ncbi:MAG TPA: sigma-70 family RNA polymerase sigma factor, partial [Kribbella sp.]|nr:sigma-70 family RNA polymerase sigma factor [Kribbella sp.]
MDDHEQLARRFEENRAHLRAVAYRMLGSVTEAEDAVQEGWLRLSRTDVSDVGNLGGWLTTVVSRVCLDMLRSRKSRREDALDTYVPDPVISAPGPEDEAVQADAIGLALLVVLETLAPAERLAFVLHDMFGVGFDEIASIVDKSPAATRQLASRARRRVQGAPASDGDVSRQRVIVEAFLAASRGGDFEALLELLDPEVLLRADAGTASAQYAGPAVSKLVRGAREVVEQA